MQPEPVHMFTYNERRMRERRKFGPIEAITCANTSNLAIRSSWFWDFKKCTDSWFWDLEIVSEFSTLRYFFLEPILITSIHYRTPSPHLLIIYAGTPSFDEWRFSLTCRLHYKVFLTYKYSQIVRLFYKIHPPRLPVLNLSFSNRATLVFISD